METYMLFGLSLPVYYGGPYTGGKGYYAGLLIWHPRIHPVLTVHFSSPHRSTWRSNLVHWMNQNGASVTPLCPQFFVCKDLGLG